MFDRYLPYFVDFFGGLHLANLSNHPFVNSFKTSLFSDLVFFGTIGMVSLIVTTKLPMDEEFNYRIKTIANRKDLDTVVHDYLEKITKESLFFDSATTIKVSIKDYHPEASAIKIWVEATTKIKILNITKDNKVDISNNRLEFEPGPYVNGYYGSIFEISYTRSDSGESISHLKNGPIQLSSEGWKDSCHIPVPIDGHTQFRYSYDCWMQVATGEVASSDQLTGLQILGHRSNRLSRINKVIISSNLPADSTVHFEVDGEFHNSLYSMEKPETTRIPKKAIYGGTEIDLSLQAVLTPRTRLDFWFYLKENSKDMPGGSGGK